MFGIGAVARLTGISHRTLRYYDDIGLLSPDWIDPSTGYRWYEPQQIHRLHRILALRDMGVRLVEISRLLEHDVSVDELRKILLLKRAETHDQLVEATERLDRVETRIAHLEERNMADYDVIVKSSDSHWVLAASEQLAGLDGIVAAHGRLWPQLHATLDRLGVDFVPPSIAIERGSGPIEFTAALLVPDGVSYDVDGVSTMELPGLDRVAATVMRGDGFDAGFAALHAWIAESGEQETGELREIYLDCDGPRDTWVVELQLALEPRH